MIRAFSDGDLDAAAALLEQRHARHRQVFPQLPAEVDYREEIAALSRTDGASGAAAGGGYLLGAPRTAPVWGANVWIEAAGHAASHPELARDLYGSASVGWVERGLKAHFVLVPATGPEFVDARFRLGFGAQQAHGIIEIPAAHRPANVREAREDDVDALVALAPLLQKHQWLSPVFSGAPLPSEEEYRADIIEDMGRDDIGNLVVEADGRVVGNFVVAPLELSNAHAGLARPPGAAYLAFAVTHPDARGSGAGVALTDACFAWARAHGYETMVTDWRVTNLLSSRFWPRRGLRTSFLRLHRLIA
jgi:ribosomal protein S18 acetylase RimI-like enzyme